MQKKIFLTALLLSILFTGGCSINHMPKEMPKDFGFVVKYGFGAKNELDTFKGQFTKDLIADGTATAQLQLSKEDMTTIYEAMRRINIMGFPVKYSPGSISFFQKHVTPYQTYDLQVSFGGETKEIHWDDDTLSNTAGARDLRSLVETIRSMVETKEEFKKLPPAKGGYD